MDNFNFGQSGSLTNFNFTESGYVPGNLDFSFGTFVSIYFVLKGTSNNITSIWADSNAGLDSGKVYTSTSKTLNIINLQTNSISDYYTQTHFGSDNDVLNSDDVVDINVV